MQERRLDGGRRGGYFAAFSRIFLTFLQQSFKIIKLCENRKTSRFSGREGIDEENLTKDIKKRLLSIVDATVLINNEKFTMLNAIDKYTDSLFNSFKKQNVNELIEVSIWI